MTMKSSIRIELAVRCLSLALIGGALLGSQVFAAEPTDPPTMTVKYGDLNLQAPVGVETLYKRIHSAAKQVCAIAGDRELSFLTLQHNCVASAESAAIQQVHNEALSAYYQAKIGRPNALVAMSSGK
jgi:UrcA family protein